MKTAFCRTLVLAGLAQLLCFSAQAEVKIGIIDLKKVFEEYYKTKQASANLQDEKADIDKDYKDLVERFKKGEDEWKKLLDKANDQAISSEEREKSKQTAEKKLLDLRELEQTIKQFERVSTSKMNDKQERLREKILVEIREVINTRAKGAGYSLVLDTAARSVSGMPMVLFTNGENDLTDNVLTQLNAAAPATATKPAEEKKK